MSKPETEIAAALEAIVGNAHVIANPELQIDKLTPAWLVEPASAQEVAACLGACAERNLAVVPAGRGTWLECGNPLRRADVVLSLERLGRVVDYSAPDLTVTVEAGMALGELNKTVGADRLWLPLDPPGADTASVGAIAACNSSGALRGGYGAPRDYVIGLKLAHADGLESKSGGRVAKNVAGYDLNKLYVGSYGTLAVITELTFKLRPLPEQSVTIALTPRDPDAQPAALARQVRASELQPAAYLLTSMSFEEIFGRERGLNVWLLRFADNEAAVTYQKNWLRRACGETCKMAEVSNEAEAALWAKVNAMDSEPKYVVRISVPLSQTIDIFESVRAEGDTPVTADLGSGIIRAAWDGIDDVAVPLIKRHRARVERVGGTLYVEKAPSLVRQAVGAWSEVGAGERLMKAVKEKFDPRGILNPGRFVAGI